MINIYHTSRAILRNETQIALLRKVQNKPLCMAQQKIIQRLRRLTKDLTYVRMSVDRDIAMAKVIDGHYDNLRQLLREIEFITSASVDSKDGRRRSGDDQVKESQIVCPEVYKGSTYGYPFYRKGFQTDILAEVEKFIAHNNNPIIFTNAGVKIYDNLNKFKMSKIKLIKLPYVDELFSLPFFEFYFKYI